MFPVSSSWSLYPFCGTATCVQEGGKLYEQVAECPRPKPKTGCQITQASQDRTIEYPNCCPQPVCEDGVTPEWYTQAEAEELSKKEAEEARQRAAAAAAAAQGTA